jgi:hypothetical protein
MGKMDYQTVRQMAYDGVDCDLALHFEGTDTTEKTTPAGLLTTFGEMADKMVMDGERDTLVDAIEYIDKIAYITKWADR